MNVEMVDENTIVEVACLRACAFDFSCDEHLKTKEKLSDERNKLSSYDDIYWKDCVVALEDNKVIGTVGCCSYQVYFDENIVNMSGIGGVATYPEYRDRGAIRACFEKCFEYMQETNQILSYLYPFSACFYRQFGYGPLCDYTKWLVPIQDIPKKKLEGSFSLHKKDEPIDEVKLIYQSFASHYNMMVARHELHFKKLLENDPYKDNEYLYTFKNSNGEAISYVFFKKSNDDVLKVLDYAFIDFKGMEGILHIISKYISAYECFEMDLESTFPLDRFIPETTGIKRTTFTSGCARVIDVKKALLLARYKGSGSINIRVIDKYIQKNNQTFELIFADSKAVNVTASSNTPDITLDIADFSSLILGHTSIKDFFVLYENDKLFQTLENVFYHKKCMIKEYF